MGRARDIASLLTTSSVLASDSEVASLYTPLSSPVSSYKNKIINGGFDIWQRGTSFSTNNVYTADRWVIVGASGQTVSVSQQSFTPGTAPVSGYEGTYFARLGWSGTPSGTYWFTQRIEDVRTLAGQTVTLSFWAKASSTTSALTPMFEQNFGSGGSSVVSTTGSAITLTTSWQRFTQTFSIPSISGKTIGTNSYIEVRPFNGSTAVTGNSIDIWGVQVEKGSIATEFEQRFIGDELKMCQRYFYNISAARFGTPFSIETQIGIFTAQASTTAYTNIFHPQIMRSQPIATLSGNVQWTQTGVQNTISSFSNTYSTPLGTLIEFTTSALTVGSTGRLTIASGATGVISVNAEL
jgi:hypothetical protein